MEDRSPSSPDKIRERVEWTLARDLSFLGGPSRRADSARNQGTLERVEEELRAFQATGLLSGAEAAGWRERFELAAEAVDAPERQSGVRVTAAELFTDSVRLWWHRTISPEEIAERDRERIQSEGESRPVEWRRAAGKFELSDDLGSSYQAQLLGSDEDTPWLWLTPWRINPDAPEPLPPFGHAIFMPAVPEGAARLEAVSGSDRFVLELAG